MIRRFQARPLLRRAAGVYYISDKYCVVCSDLRPDFRAEVFEHELIHAYCRRTAKSFSSSRFITEGIAEYLRLATPRDNGLNVPVANDFPLSRNRRFGAVVESMAAGKPAGADRRRAIDRQRRRRSRVRGRRQRARHEDPLVQRRRRGRRPGVRPADRRW